MPHLDLKPTNRIVSDYYGALKQLSLLHAGHEGAVRGAFGNLLNACAHKFKWTLVNEYEIRRKKKLLRVDGALVDPWSLTHGFWEAKDDDDDLAVEAKKKIDLGYPTDNILFQAPDRAILYQDGKRVLDERIGVDRKGALVDVVRAFFDHEEPYQEQWQKAVADFKDQVPQLARALEDIIAKERSYPHFKDAFDRFAEVCRASLNPQLADEAVEKMLVQHILTERIFRKVFDNPDFVRRNVIASEIEQVIDKLTQRSFSRDKFLGGLDRFYRAIEDTASSTVDFTEKQHFLNKVYESFFQGFDAKTADTHGIVYTPQPIVRFMVNSVDEILAREFNTSLGERGVHILDPFVGTGNFILSLMRHLPKTRLEYKYAHELHANEVLLLPYYISSMNIEHEYAELTGEYRPFEGLCLVDTFELAEEAQRSFAGMTEKNTERVEAQKKAPITVIIGNPPYNAWQIDENDGNKNRRYKVVDARVAATYAKASRATLVNSLSDPYVKAFRWASDRLGEEGVLAYVSNNGYLDGLACDGMRKHLARDFDAIYLLDLGGNVRKNPKLSGTTHNVFGIQVGVAICFLIKHKREKNAERKAEIFYARVGEDWRKEAKFAFLDDGGTAGKIVWQRIEPDAKQAWLTAGLRADFDGFMALTADSFGGETQRSIFRLMSNGLKSQRDATVYGFSRDDVARRTRSFIDAYENELRRWRKAGQPGDIDAFVDTRNLKWSRNLKRHFERGAEPAFDDQNIRIALYRPFSRQHLYFARIVIDEVGQLFRLFPTAETKNRSMWLKTGGESPNYVLATDRIADLMPQGGSRLFAIASFGTDGALKDNITDWALDQFQSHYADTTITKWALFHYVYGILHHPDYRTRYEANLKRELPRIPFAPDFWGFAKAGEALATLHLDYEKQREYPLKRIEGDGALDWRVERMKLSKDKTQIVYNDFLTLAGIPPEVFEYRLGNRSALEWIVDQYQVSTDARSGIQNDPNRADDPEYIVRLIGQVVTVSIETMKTVRALPALDAGDPKPERLLGAVRKPTMALDEQVAALKKLRKGWHEPETPAPDRATLDLFGGFLARVVKMVALPEPFLYATLDGGAQAEWPHGEWEIAARIEPGSKTVNVQASSLVERTWRSIVVSAVDADAVTAFAEFIRALPKGR